MQAIASATAVRPQFAGAKKSFAAKKVRDATRASRENGIATVPCYFARDGKIPHRASPRVTPRRLTDAPSPRRVRDPQAVAVKRDVRVKADWSIGSPENTVRFATMRLHVRVPSALKL